MNIKELNRKIKIFWLTAQIKYHRIVMDAELGVTDHWKYHARIHTDLCRVRNDLMTRKERGLV